MRRPRLLIAALLVALAVALPTAQIRIRTVAAGGGSGDSPLSQNCWPRLDLSCTTTGTSDDVSAFNTRINTGGEWRSDYGPASTAGTFANAMDALYTSYNPTVADDKATIGIRAHKAALMYFAYDTYNGGSAFNKAQWAAKAKAWIAVLMLTQYSSGAVVSSITRTNSTTVRVLTASAHGLTNNRVAGIIGANEPEFNVADVITVVDADEFDLPSPGSTGSATGSDIRFSNANDTINTGQGDCAIFVVKAVDLLWPSLSDAEKRTYFGWLRMGGNIATTANPIYGITTIANESHANWGNNHWVEAVRTLISTAILFKGAGINDSWCDTLLSWYDVAVRGSPGGWMTNNSIRGGLTGSWIQGSVYGLAYNQHVIAELERYWRISHGITRATHYPTTGAGRHLRGYPIHAVNHLRPWGETDATSPTGKAIRGVRTTHASWWGDFDYTNQKMAYGFYVIANELDGLYQDGSDLSRWLGATLHKEATNPEWWALTKFFRAKGTAKSPATIGLATSAYLDAGQLIWRSAHYDGSVFNHALVFAEAHKWQWDDPPPVGSFQLDYMGPSVVRPGSGGHDADAIGLCGFGNYVVAVDPTRTALEGDGADTNCTDTYDDQGGQRIDGGTALFNSAGGDLGDYIDYSLLRFLGVGQNDADEKFGYSYIPQDRAYFTDTVAATHGVTQKWASLNRQIVTRLPDTPGTDPLHVWVFDNGTTKSTSYQKRYYTFVASPTAPTITGTPTSGQPVRNGSGTGKTLFTGADRVSSVNNSNGATNTLFLRWYCPTSTMDVVRVQYRRDSTPNDDIETAYGLVFNSGSQPPDETNALPYLGHYRLELIPTTPVLKDNCVQVYSVHPSTSATEETVTQVTGTGWFGYRVGNQVAVSCTTNGTTTGSFTLPASMTNAEVILACPTATGSATWSIGGDITAMTRKADGGGATTGATWSSASTIQLSVTTGAGGNRTVTVN